MKNAFQQRLSIFIMALILLMMVDCSQTHASSQTVNSEGVLSLTSVKIENDTLIIKGNQPFTYALYKSTDPYHASIEIPNMSTGHFSDKITTDHSNIAEIVPLQIESPQRIARIDIVLQNPSVLTPEYKENILTIAVKKDEPLVLAGVKEPETSPKASVRLAIEETPLAAEQPQKGCC